MKNYILLLIFTVFLLFGCSLSTPEAVNQNDSTDDLAVVEVDSVVDGNIYKNNLYGFQFIISEGTDLNRDQRFRSIEDHDPLYYISLYFGDSINTNIYVYHKEARIKDVESSFTKYKKLESYEGQDVEMWESGPLQGPANWWFLNTLFLGEKYAYEIETSNVVQSEVFFDKHVELSKSFVFFEGY